MLQMQDKRFRVGIIGAGHIAEKAARTLRAMKDAECLSIGSRSLEKASAFADAWDIPRAYGSYSALLDDPDIDLVYVATPHSHHFAVTREALLKGKPCLVEKSFMANAAETEEILSLSAQRRVFVAEAIWTRYLPVMQMVRDLIAEGAIGAPKTLSATLSYAVADKERILRPELCGGALLDLGVYALHFIRACNPSPVRSMQSQCIKADTGVDLSEAVSLVLEDGTLASFLSSAACIGDNIGVVAGTEANLVVDKLTNPSCIRLYRKDHALIRELRVPKQITGFEYEFRACRDAIAAGAIEPAAVPHSEILYVMQLMDALRRDWGVRFPMDPQ